MLNGDIKEYVTNPHIFPALLLSLQFSPSFSIFPDGVQLQQWKVEESILTPSRERQEGRTN